MLGHTKHLICTHCTDFPPPPPADQCPLQRTAMQEVETGKGRGGEKQSVSAGDNYARVAGLSSLCSFAAFS